MIPYGRQEITQADVDAVVEVLRSDFLTQGPMVPSFEKSVAGYVGVNHAIAVNSATSALHIACLSLGLGPGDWLWTSPISFVASSNCGLYCGAMIDFVDIDPCTYNLCPKALEKKLEQAEREGRLPKIVIPVHLCGQPCDMASIHALSKRYGFNIIEDASHAIGAKYRGKFIGNCQYSDISIFSFHPVKIITTAEGGMATTNNSELAARMSLLRSHGITREQNLMTQSPDGPWYYQQIELGFNYRMNEIQAALGISQMKRLDEFVARRNTLALRYDELLSTLPVTTPWQHSDGKSARHLYIIRLNKKTVSISKNKIFKIMNKNEISVNIHYIPIHTQPWYRKLGFDFGMFPESESYYLEALTLPLYPAMTTNEQDKVVTILKNILQDSI